MEADPDQDRGQQERSAAWRAQHITGESPESDDVTAIGDSTGRLKQWFDTHPVGFVVIRPDRYVAVAALAQHAPSVAAALAAALHLTSGDHHDARTLLDVAQPAAGALAAAG